MNDVDVVFHDILLQKAMRQDGDSITGFRLRDSLAQAQLVGLYATQAESVRNDLERQCRANDEVVAMANDGGSRGLGSALSEVSGHITFGTMNHSFGSFLFQSLYCNLILECHSYFDTHPVLIALSSIRIQPTSHDAPY